STLATPASLLSSTTFTVGLPPGAAPYAKIGKKLNRSMLVKSTDIRLLNVHCPAPPAFVKCGKKASEKSIDRRSPSNVLGESPSMKNSVAALGMTSKRLVP